jgi:CO dehydrogenase/acetyl-CoA synthase alpha subunit
LWFYPKNLFNFIDLFKRYGIEINLSDLELEDGSRTLKYLISKEEVYLKIINYSKRNPISKAIRHEVLKRDNYKCVECGATKENQPLEIDHIIPVSQGGFDEINNLQTLCFLCNRAKGNRAWKGGK